MVEVVAMIGFLLSLGRRPVPSLATASSTGVLTSDLAAVLLVALGRVGVAVPSVATKCNVLLLGFLQSLGGCLELHLPDLDDVLKVCLAPLIRDGLSCKMKRFSETTETFGLRLCLPFLTEDCLAACHLVNRSAMSVPIGITT